MPAHRNERTPLLRHTHEPILRPSPLQKRDELAAQLSQLRTYKQQDEVDAQLYRQRRREIERCLGRLSRGNEAYTPALDTIAHSRAARLGQRALTALAHPAAWWLPPRSMAVRQCGGLILRGIAEGWAARCTFWADDEGAALLDGLRIAKEHVHDAHGRPHIFVVVGFAMTYEAIVQQAKSFADDFDCVVVLHNSRGVGRSLGRQLSLDQAVEDCKGVVRTLLREGHRYLGGYGISMGSASVFRAVEQMAAAGELGVGDIGLLVSVRGLSSIPQVVGAHLGGCFAAASAWLLRRANLPAMDVQRVVQAPLLSAQIMITTADNDWLVKGQGQLARALGHGASGEVLLPSGQQATLVFGHGRGHVDANVRTPEHDAVLARWAERARVHVSQHAEDEAHVA